MSMFLNSCICGSCLTINNLVFMCKIRTAKDLILEKLSFFQR